MSILMCFHPLENGNETISVVFVWCLPWHVVRVAQCFLENSFVAVFLGELNFFGQTLRGFHHEDREGV